MRETKADLHKTINSLLNEREELLIKNKELERALDILGMEKRISKIEDLIINNDFVEKLKDLSTKFDDLEYELRQLRLRENEY